MANVLQISPAGLYSFPSRLASVPTGALIRARNVVLNRDKIVESRRGFKLYSNAMGSVETNTAHQLLVYKDRLLRHWGAEPGQYLDYDNGSGTFESFAVNLSATTHSNTTIDGVSTTSGLTVGMYVTGSNIPDNTTITSISSNTAIVISQAATSSATLSLTFTYKISEVSQGTRIKGLESNGNFYFTSSEGIKKISALNSASLSSSTITQAGGVKGLDVIGSINNSSGFLSATSAVAYRVVWGIKDNNNNVILGTPSARIIVRNPSTVSKTVNLTITIPKSVTTTHFYQVYRSDVIADAGGTDPGDELKLAYESNPTSSDLTAGFLQITDVTPDSFLNAYLYTNQNSGDGINQANDIPPLASDITSFKGYTFYANTSTFQGIDISMLSISLLQSYQAGSITGNTVANPTVITSANHGLSTGRIITITGSNSTPSLNGSRTVTVINANTFSVPVNVTVSGSSGSWVTTDHSTITTTDGTTTNTYKFKYTDVEADTHTNTTVDGIADTSILSAGMSVSGTDIPTGAYIVSVDSANSITISVAATGTTSNISLRCAVESVSNKYVALSQFATPSQQVNETAQSLIRIINRQSSEILYAYYISGVDDVPGQMFFEARELDQDAFWVTVNNATTGTQFNPSLPTTQTTSSTSTNEVSPNRIFYSKYQQPEAVPILNFIDIGPKDKRILRVLALRDNLFILKEEGVYRLSGVTSSQFVVYPFDFSTSIVSSDSAVVLNNLIYMFSDQGVATVSDTGVSIISRPIEDQLIKLITPQYTNFTTATFGLSYESDRAYYLFTVSSTSDIYATQCFRFNTFTNTWTILGLEKRSGVVNPLDDKLYLAPTDINYIEVERKTFDRTDYADREYELSIGANSVDGIDVALSSVENVSEGDVLVQTQYLTIAQFNRQLIKLDNDTYTSPHNYFSTLEAVPGDNLSTSLDSLLAKVRDDAGRTGVTGGLNGNNQAVTITNASPAVFTNATNTTGYYNGMPILFTTTGTLPTGLTANTIYYVSNLNTDGVRKFRVSATFGGVDVNTSTSGSGTHTTVPAYSALIGKGVSSFQTLQTTFNLLVNLLNNDSGIGSSTYSSSSNSVNYEFYVTDLTTSDNTITTAFPYPLIAGPITSYSHIDTDIQFVPQTMGDVSMTKQVSEGTFIFEDASFTKAEITYSSDLSGNFEGKDISGTGNGIFGNVPFGEGPFGGNGTAVPFRTYLPRNKQRCRYINARFKHAISREIFYLYGVSFTYNVVSQRGWR